MDPDETLRQLRLLVKQQAVDESPLVQQAHSDEIAELFNALDNWIVTGGFLPSAWQNGK